MKIVDGWSAVGTNEIGKSYSYVVGFHRTRRAAQAACDTISEIDRQMHEDEPFPSFEIVPAKAEERSFSERFRKSASNCAKYDGPSLSTFPYAFFLVFSIIALTSVFLSAALETSIFLAAPLLSVPLAAIFWFNQVRLKMDARYRQLKTEQHPTTEYI